jgi:hypothetical protein
VHLIGCPDGTAAFSCVRVRHLATARDVPLRIRILIELLKQLLDQSSLRELLAEQPQRGAIGNVVLEFTASMSARKLFQGTSAASLLADTPSSKQCC